MGFPGMTQMVKNLPAMQEIWIRSLIPWRNKWQPTQGFLLENSMDRGGWQATVHGVATSRP